LKDSVLEPALAIVDFAKFDKPASMHIGMRALDAFYVKNKAFPQPWDQKQADEVIALAKEINNNRVDSLDVKMIIF
jgi:ubiquitin-activating enzyme E1